jgi:peptidoglycan/xylan/chitin deacetylase (PgdA/CDA1 family)
LRIGGSSKRWIKRSLLSSGALRFGSRFLPHSVAILMYHSVMDDPAKHANTLGDIIHPTLIFQRQMEVIARDFNPVSLDDALLFVQGKKRLPAKAVVVTFDDGYADNLEVAAPILNRFGIPAIVYATVGCIDKSLQPWVSRLRYSFLTTKKPRWVDAQQQKWELGDKSARRRAYEAAAACCARLAGDAQERFVNDIEHDLEVEPVQENLMMTWDQARQLIRQGHMVGSHGMSHPNLAHIKSNDLEFELGESKKRLEQELDGPIRHFSYPCPTLQPHWSAATVAVCRTLGYATAVTVDSGPVRNGDDPLFLHRVPAPAEVEGLRWNLECAFLGRAT